MRCLPDQERRRFELDSELTRIDARLADIEQRLRAADGLHRYTTMAGVQVDLDQDRTNARARHIRLRAELTHLDLQLEETRRRIAAFDQIRRADGG